MGLKLFSMMSLNSLKKSKLYADNMQIIYKINVKINYKIDIKKISK
jgi:hypothetical protein